MDGLELPTPVCSQLGLKTNFEGGSWYSKGHTLLHLIVNSFVAGVHIYLLAIQSVYNFGEKITKNHCVYIWKNHLRHHVPLVVA